MSANAPLAELPWPGSLNLSACKKRNLKKSPTVKPTSTRGGVKSGYTSHTKPALFVSRITPVPEYDTGQEHAFDVTRAA